MAKGVVVIDPGHGGNLDTGNSSKNNAVSPSGVLEKNMTLRFAFLVRDALKAIALSGAHDIKVFLTRDSDVNLGLADRAAVAKSKKADIFLSIHFNGFNGVARGTETLISPKIDKLQPRGRQSAGPASSEGHLQRDKSPRHEREE